MKIGILTLPFNNNYGGYLQAYALMTILKREGHEVELIYRRHSKQPAKDKIIPTIKNIIKVLLGRKVVSIIPDEEKSFRARGVNMMPVLDNMITPKSRPLYSSKEFNEYVSGRYDVVIVGSDQVWRPDYGPEIRDYFFCGIPDKELIRLSYAASFGTDNPVFTDAERTDCAKALKKFNAISVREESGQELVRCMGYSAPQLVLDPTLLLTAEDYNAIIPRKDSPSKGKIFCYVLDMNDEKEKFIDRICHQTSKKRYTISDIQKGDSVLPSVEEWLMAIRDADMVITDSYHGTVFSVIFQKEFICFTNSSRGSSRMDCLRVLTGINDRFIDVSVKLPNNRIEYDVVNMRIEKLKAISIDFLKSNLIH